MPYKSIKTIDLSTTEGRHQFYRTREWQVMRRIILTEEPFCVECKKNGINELAVDCDHIIDIKDRKDLCFAKDNLQSLCKSCHSRKTFNDNVRDNFRFHKKMEICNRKWNILPAGS